MGDIESHGILRNGPMEDIAELAPRGQSDTRELRAIAKVQKTLRQRPVEK